MIYLLDFPNEIIYIILSFLKDMSTVYHANRKLRALCISTIKSRLTKMITTNKHIIKTKENLCNPALLSIFDHKLSFSLLNKNISEERKELQCLLFNIFCRTHLIARVTFESSLDLNM